MINETFDEDIFRSRQCPMSGKSWPLCLTALGRKKDIDRKQQKLMQAVP
jgi:hypothetical protein